MKVLVTEFNNDIIKIWKDESGIIHKYLSNENTEYTYNSWNDWYISMVEDLFGQPRRMFHIHALYAIIDELVENGFATRSEIFGITLEVVDSDVVNSIS